MRERVRGSRRQRERERTYEGEDEVDLYKSFVLSLFRPVQSSVSFPTRRNCGRTIEALNAIGSGCHWNFTVFTEQVTENRKLKKNSLVQRRCKLYVELIASDDIIIIKLQLINEMVRLTETILHWNLLIFSPIDKYAN